ncbi:MAG: Chitin synthase, class 5 [Chaenotheca gracillima]|nr:MAG: Chitin synthase, class 5 [Chaenotheca gracillima]
MGDAEVKTSSWRLVELGRVVLFTKGPFDGKLATIVEIIDHKRILVDGPSSDEKLASPRHSSPLSHVVLTPIVIPHLPRSARTGAIKKLWEKNEVEKKWSECSWAKKREQKERRRQLSDFDRFKVMRLKKQARYEVRKSFAKVRAAAK